MKRVIVLFVAAIGFPGGLRSQGESATAPVLLLPASTRGMALGGSSASLAGRDEALFFNPALVLSPKGGLTGTVSYQPYIEGSRASAVSLASGRGGRSAFGIGVALLDYGESPEILPDPSTGGEVGVATGRVIGASEFSLTVSYARALGSGIVGGVSMKGIRQDLAGEAGQTGAVDLGVTVPFRGANLSAAIQNLGPGIEVAGRRGGLPRLARIGGSFDASLGPTFGAGMTAEVVSVAQEVTISTGLEARWALSSTLIGAVRVGYRGGGRGDLAGPVTLGLGASTRALAVDYGVQWLDVLGQPTHRIGLHWKR